MILYLITGQFREGRIAAESHIQNVQYLRDRYGKDSVCVLCVVWDTSFHIFPKAYRSFIETNTEDLSSVYSALGDDFFFKIVSLNDGNKFLAGKSIPNGADDFSLRAYLNWVCLNETLRIEHITKKKFAAVVKTRPDVITQEFSLPSIELPYASIAVGAATQRFNGGGNVVVSPQANDGFEIMDRVGFLLYGQMIWSLNDSYRCPLFFHTWAAEYFARQCMLIVDRVKITETIVRPLYRLLDGKTDINSLKEHDRIWQKDVNGDGERWISLMNERGFKYEVR